MSKVYFKAIKNFDDVNLINEISYNMLQKYITDEKIQLKKKVPLKVHFGEPGNDTFIRPEYFAGIRKYLQEKDITSYYMDSNVLYKGKRTFTKDHLATATAHGFTDLEVIIGDGDEQDAFAEIPVHLKYCDTCKIGKKYQDYDNYLVLAHFKGHGLAGFGGAIKQLGMGFASRGGKLQQHSNVVPVIDQNKCISCAACTNKCPVDAISLNPKAQIDPNLCIGCASCTVVCPVNAITNTWDQANFFEKLAEYAYAAALNKTNIYFNFAFNITGDCDCNGRHMPLVAPNIGLFISSDPVAIDAASLAKVQDATGTKLFDKARRTLNYAESIGLGTKDYELIEF